MKRDIHLLSRPVIVPRSSVILRHAKRSRPLPIQIILRNAIRLRTEAHKFNGGIAIPFKRAHYCFGALQQPQIPCPILSSPRNPPSPSQSKQARLTIGVPAARAPHSPSATALIRAAVSPQPLTLPRRAELSTSADASTAETVHSATAHTNLSEGKATGSMLN